MTRKNDGGGVFLRLLFLFVLALGLGLVLVLVRQPQSYKSQAAASKPLPIACGCSGAGKCKRLTSQTACVAKNCSWTCPATMITPNGGEVWTRGSTYTVTWNQVTPSAWTHIVAYTRNSSGNYTSQGAIDMYVDKTVGTHSYSWTIGQPGTPSMNMPDGTNYYAAVELYDSTGKVIYRDMSNSAFTIKTPEKAR